MNNIKNKFKQIPKFKNEDDEIDFWDKNDATDYFDFDHPVNLDLSSLKPSTEKVTVRLPKMMLDDLKIIANLQDVPYQSLMKIFLSQKIDEVYYSRFNSPK